MRYKIIVSNEYDNYTLYSDYKEEADMIYAMAVHSNMFTYVDLREVREVDTILRDWSDDNA